MTKGSMSGSSSQRPCLSRDTTPASSSERSIWLARTGETPRRATASPVSITGRPRRWSSPRASVVRIVQLHQVVDDERLHLLPGRRVGVELGDVGLEERDHLRRERVEWKLDAALSGLVQGLRL